MSATPPTLVNYPAGFNSTGKTGSTFSPATASPSCSAARTKNVRSTEVPQTCLFTHKFP